VVEEMKRDTEGGAPGSSYGGQGEETGCFYDVNYVRPSSSSPASCLQLIRMSDRQKPDGVRNCVVCIRATATTSQVGLRGELDQG
jgi:hypothetical protein